MQTFTTEQVMAAAGASYRQLDYWIHLGYLPMPKTQTGVPRRWTREQMTRAATLTALVAAGLEPRHASGITEQITRIGPVTITLDTAAIERQIEHYLTDALTDTTTDTTTSTEGETNR